MWFWCGFVFFDFIFLWHANELSNLSGIPFDFILVGLVGHYMLGLRCLELPVRSLRLHILFFDLKLFPWWVLQNRACKSRSRFLLSKKTSPELIRLGSAIEWVYKYWLFRFDRLLLFLTEVSHWSFASRQVNVLLSHKLLDVFVLVHSWVVQNTLD